MRFQPDDRKADTVITLQAWRRFVAGGEADGRVRSHVRAAWQRSRRHGCSPHMPSADVLSPAATVALLERESRLIELSSPFLGALSRAAGSERHAAMLADSEGRVLKIVADPLTAADQNFPRAGSLLSEAAAGANGIGTPLADGRYVELVGPEHYIEGFHAFTCQGVALQSVAGTAAGVISISVRRVETADRVRDILFCASEAAECELLSAQLSDTLGRHIESGSVLESLRQDVVQRIATTRLQLEVAARRIATGADASATLRAAEELIDSFRRQATIWRNLADDGIGAPEPICIADLVHGFLALMATEARVAEVQLVEDRMDRALAFDDLKALSRRLLGASLDALQRAMPGTSLQVDTAASKSRVTIRLRGIDLREQPFELELDAPRLP